MVLFSVILIIATVATGGFIGYLDSQKRERVADKNYDLRRKGKENEQEKLPSLISAKQLITLALGVLAFLSFGIHFVEANHVGIHWSRINGTQTETLKEGFNFVFPLDRVYEIPTTVQERAFRDTKKSQSALNVQTKDSQVARVEAVVKYKINKENAFSVFQNYETIDNLNSKIIKNYSHQAIEEAMLKHNITDVLGESKNDIYKGSKEVLAELLAKEGIELVDLTIDDIDAGDEIEEAIAETAKAKQSLETAEQKRLKAETEAATKIIKAQGTADANRILNESMTANTKFKDFLKVWDGKLPMVQGGNGEYMLDISKILGDE